MKKTFLIIGIIFGGILLLLVAFLAVWFLWPWNTTFFNNAQKEFAIPGLDTAFVPQGFTKVDGQEKYIIGGYMSDGTPSRYYVVDKTSGVAEKYFTLSIDSKNYVGHACGIASSQNNLWICSADGGPGMAYRFLLSDVESVENGGKVNVIDYFETNNGADNITAYNGYLWIGEFYRKGNYETNSNHKLTTRDGSQNTAIAYAYEIDNYNNYGVADTIPDMALSTIGLVQGIAFTANGEILLSTSYSLPDSNIYSYENVLLETAHSSITVNGDEVDLWFLDNESLIKKTNVPAMAEEIVVDSDKVLILSESACKKYKIFNRKKVKDVYSLSVDFVLGK